MDAATSGYPWRWRLQELFVGLPVELSCSAGEVNECWLIRSIAAWNKALRVTRLALTEFEPGKLCLRSYEDRDEALARYQGTGNANDGAFLIAWLPRQHPCIREVHVYDRPHIDCLSFMSSIIAGPASNLQRIVVHPSCGLLPDNKFFEAFGSPEFLRELDLTNVLINNALAPMVADVLRGNGQTLQTVKLIGNDLSRECASILILALMACERLEDLSLEDSTKSSAYDAMSEAFRSSRFLKKLSLLGLCETGMSCEHLSGRRGCVSCLTSLFGALEAIPSFQHLALENTSISDSVGEALAKFLTGHHSLQTLSLLNCSFERKGAKCIAEALSMNCALENLNLQKSSFDEATFNELCAALPSNTKLRRLLLPRISSTSRILQENNPTLELLRLECPGRVQFCLSVDQPSLESETLAQALGCATKVKICHRGLVAKFLCSVYVSLALNHSLRSLNIEYESVANCRDGKAQAEITSALCEALNECKCLQSFCLDVRRAYSENEETAPLMAKIFNSVQRSPRLRKLKLLVSGLTLRTTHLLSLAVGHLKTSLVEVHIESTGNIKKAVLDVLEEMIAKNIFLTKVRLICDSWRDVVWEPIEEAKEENQGLLNKAAKFVMCQDGQPEDTGKDQCASAFDELCSTASLKEHLVSLCGKSELEVSMDVKKTRCYLDDNYMIYAGVVRSTVACEAGHGSTQFDALNIDCWRSIVQYLKLSDVV